MTAVLVTFTPAQQELQEATAKRAARGFWNWLAAKRSLRTNDRRKRGKLQSQKCSSRLLQASAPDASVCSSKETTLYAVTERLLESDRPVPLKCTCCIAARSLEITETKQEHLQ
jgi:hypothetical protein